MQATPMISFESDYNNGAHPSILERLADTNGEQSSSYGYDHWSEQARSKIRQACHLGDEAEIFFLVGGTQTNATVIDALLPSYCAVIATETAHINVHESGAIEARGHKVITLPSHNGRLSATDLEAFLQGFFSDPTWEHMAVPKMIYVTFPTELGTIYTVEELEGIYTICQQYKMSLYIDGARLGYGLMAQGGDITLPWLARHCDAFYIGGTKVGALCGEAVVFPKGGPQGFFTMVKRQGALLAKSRLAGVQFDTLFTDDLYLTISRHAVNMAMRLREMFNKYDITITDSPTNQQFAILSRKQQQWLGQHILFETWKHIDDDHTLCRFVTSWATTEADLKILDEALKSLPK